MMKPGLLGALNLLIPALSIAGPVEIKQQSPDYRFEQPLLEDKAQNGPDERIAWRLYHAGKFEELSRQIEYLKQLHPQWQVPTDLSKALQSKQRSTDKLTDTRQHQSARTAKNTDTACPDKYSSWQRAESYIKSNLPLKAFELYEHMMARCRAQQDLMQTLETAKITLEYGDFIRLLELARPHLPLSYLDRLRHESLKADYLNSKALDAQQQENYVTRLNTYITLVKDDDLAAIIGWRYYDLQNYDAAIRWFQQAGTWNVRNPNAGYGLLLSLERIGEYERILTLAGGTKELTADMQSVVGRIYKLKAWQALESNSLITAAENVKLARDRLGADADLQELEAWLAQKNNHHDDAAKRFDELYRQSPTQKYAQAYVLNQAVADGNLLERRARQAGGLLWDEYNNYQAKELYSRKQFQSAYKQAPSVYPELQNIDTSSVDMGGYARFKSGEEGLSRLDLFRLPVAGFSYTAFGNHTFKLGLSRVQLSSGRPEACQSDIGSLTPEASARASCRSNAAKFFTPTERLDHSLEIDFSYRKDGWFSPFINLGSTPIGGVIAPAVTYDLGFVQQTGYGHWGLEAYSQPVRQSILSYTGIKDPYQGTLNTPLNAAPRDIEWGRVLSTGFKSSGFYRFNDAWNMSGAIDYAWVEGKNVADNSMVSVSAGLGRSLDLKGFNYFTVGPSFNYQHFDKNLSHFTLGHGGYFSPEHYYNIGAGVNFLTEEGRTYVVKGRVNAGFQGIKEAASPWFPLYDPNRGAFDTAHSSGEALDIELKGVWLVAPNIQLGGGGAVRKTSGFEDYTGGLFIRYFFEPRKASFSTDIPGNMFSLMY
ncbi:MAG: cellulose synthase subunit BcsC-related outer membrane protein [Methylobacter sp.]|nr:cellulose synthase subunit BcsC-related outer membrane protein [Methylobacter sp.]